MNYQLTEDEFFALECVRGQLNLLASTVRGPSNPDLRLVDSSDLWAFLDAQVKSLKSLEKATAERFEVQAGKPYLTGYDVAGMLKIACGDVLHTANGTEMKVTGQLARLALVSPDWEIAFHEWSARLVSLNGAAQVVGGVGDGVDGADSNADQVVDALRAELAEEIEAHRKACLERDALDELVMKQSVELRRLRRELECAESAQTTQVQPPAPRRAGSGQRGKASKSLKAGTMSGGNGVAAAAMRASAAVDEVA